MWEDGDKIRLLNVKQLRVDGTYKDNDVVGVIALGIYPLKDLAILNPNGGLNEVYIIPGNSEYIQKV